MVHSSWGIQMLNAQLSISNCQYSIVNVQYATVSIQTSKVTLGLKIALMDPFNEQLNIEN